MNDAQASLGRGTQQIHAVGLKTSTYLNLHLLAIRVGIPGVAGMVVVLRQKQECVGNSSGSLGAPNWSR